MKKIMLMALAVGTFAFTSCSSDDDNGLSCEELGQNYMEAWQANEDEPNDENCAALDAAAEAWQDADCEGSEVVQMCSNE